MVGPEVTDYGLTVFACNLEVPRVHRFGSLASPLQVVGLALLCLETRVVRLLKRRCEGAVPLNERGFCCCQNQEFGRFA